MDPKRPTSKGARPRSVPRPVQPVRSDHSCPRRRRGCAARVFWCLLVLSAPARRRRAEHFARPPSNSPRPRFGPDRRDPGRTGLLAPSFTRRGDTISRVAHLTAPGWFLQPMGSSTSFASARLVAPGREASCLPPVIGIAHRPGAGTQVFRHQRGGDAGRRHPGLNSRPNGLAPC